jgi:hypothetical protein
MRHPIRAMRDIAALAILAMAAAPAAWAQQTDQGQPQTPVRSPATGPATGILSNSSFELSSGIDYSVGSYGASSDTTVLDFPVDLKAQLGRLRLEGVLPYDYIKGPGQLVGGVVVATPGAPTTSRWGLGDLTLSAAYLIARENGALPSIELGGSVKAPTANAGIGTGKTDGSVSANLYKTVAPNVLLFGSVGYSWLGSPSTYALENGITAYGGVNYRPTPAQNVGVSIYYREPVALGLKSQVQVSPYFTDKLGKHWGLTFYGTAGLTNASPRYGGGLRLTVFK